MLTLRVRTVLLTAGILPMALGCGNADREIAELKAQIGTLRTELDALKNRPAPAPVDRPLPDSLRLKKIEIVDAAGVPRLLLDAAPAGPAFRMLSADGRTVRLAAVINDVPQRPKDSACFILYSELGKEAARLEARSGKPTVGGIHVQGSHLSNLFDGVN